MIYNNTVSNNPVVYHKYAVFVWEKQILLNIFENTLIDNKVESKRPRWGVSRIKQAEVSLGSAELAEDDLGAGVKGQ